MRLCTWFDLSGVTMADYSGMTTNERLFEAGLLDAFDDAVRNGHRRKMIDLPTLVQFEEDAANGMVDRILADPTRYGRLKS